MEDGEPVGRLISVSCSMYEGQQAPCRKGTYDESSMASEGRCEGQCPPGTPLSIPGASSAAECLTVFSNLFLASPLSDRVVAMNGDTERYELIKEGGVLSNPRSLVFINSKRARPHRTELNWHLTTALAGTTFLVSSLATNTVTMMSVQGDVLATFAYVTGPNGMLFIKHLETVAVASWEDEGRVIFFRVADYEERGALGKEDGDIVDMPSGAGEPRSISHGELDGECIVSTRNGQVVRLCVPGDTSCKPSVRNSVMLSSGASSYLSGIAALRSTGTYLVVESLVANVVYVRACERSERKRRVNGSAKEEELMAAAHVPARAKRAQKKS